MAPPGSNQRMELKAGTTERKRREERTQLRGTCRCAGEDARTRPGQAGSRHGRRGADPVDGASSAVDERAQAANAESGVGPIAAGTDRRWFEAWPRANLDRPAQRQMSRTSPCHRASGRRQRCESTKERPNSELDTLHLIGGRVERSEARRSRRVSRASAVKDGLNSTYNSG